LKYALPDLRSSYVPEGPAQFGTEYTCGKLRMYVCMYVYMYECTRESELKYKMKHTGM